MSMNKNKIDTAKFTVTTGNVSMQNHSFLASILGQKGIKPIDFCKEFNKIAKDVKDNSKIQVYVDIFKDKKIKKVFKFDITEQVLL